MCDDCKRIEIVEIQDGVFLYIHYNSDSEPVLIVFRNTNNLFKRKFTPNINMNFVELGKFQISSEDIKTENFDLTEIINVD